MNTIGLTIIFLFFGLCAVVTLYSSLKETSKEGKIISILLALSASIAFLSIGIVFIKSSFLVGILYSFQLISSIWFIFLLTELLFSIGKIRSWRGTLIQKISFVAVVADSILLFMNMFFHFMVDFSNKVSGCSLVINKHWPLIFHYGIICALTIYTVLLGVKIWSDENSNYPEKYIGVILSIASIGALEIIYFLFGTTALQISAILYCLFSNVLHLCFGILSVAITRIQSKNNMVDKLDSIIVMFDADGMLFNFSNKAGEVLGINSDYVGVLDEKMFVDGQLGMDFEYIIDNSSTDLILMVNSEKRYFDFKFNIARDENDNILGHIYTFNDITDLKEMYENIETELMKDSITGLYDNKALDVMLREMDIPENLPISIAVMDINGLGIVNDMLGISEGDRMMKFCNEVLKNQLEVRDFAAMNGCNTVIIMPGISEEQAMGTMEYVKEMISYQVDFPLALSIEYGVSEKVEDSIELGSVLEHARNSMLCKKLLKSDSSHSFIVNDLISYSDALGISSPEKRKRICENSSLMAYKMNLSDEAMAETKLLAALYGIGKITISENILNKPGKLNEEEWDEIKKYPIKGYHIVNSNEKLQQIAPYLLAQRERWDGNGYPNALKGKNIPIQSRIVSVAEAYEVMTHDKVYSKSMSKEEAIEELRNCAGTQFDPASVEAFIAVLDDRKKAKRE